MFRGGERHPGSGHPIASTYVRTLRDGRRSDRRYSRVAVAYFLRMEGRPERDPANRRSYVRLVDDDEAGRRPMGSNDRNTENHMTQEAILDFIRARLASTDGFTSTQVAERLETTPRTILPILTAMMKRGEIMPVMVIIEDAWGRRRKVPGYRAVEITRPRRRDPSSRK